MNVIDLLKSYLNHEFLSKTSNFIGETEHSTSKGLEAILPILLGGVLNESTHQDRIHQIWDLINHKDNQSSLLNNLNDFSIEDISNESQNISSSFIQLLFGDNHSTLLDGFSKFSNFKSSASANKLLTIAGSFVLSFLKKKSTTENYGVSGLTTWLGGYKREIINAIPSELKSILNFTNLTSTVNQEFDSKPTSDENGSNWWMWLIGLIGLLALLWTMMKACNTSDRDDMVQTKIENVNNTLNDSTTLGSNTINSNTNDLMNSLDSSVKAKWDLLGQSIKLTLPGGIEMNAPEKGVENALISFINDKSKMVDKTTWFNFDRILFETGKATLNPVSMDQISNINSILKAYPSVEIKIGGYTDNTGDPKSNQKLSLERAEAVRTSLLEKGVEGIRMVAEGYGQEHPIADNKTEAGRDLNRRVAIRVTKK